MNIAAPVSNAFSTGFNAANATLILFSPKNYVDQYRRSMTYRFDGNAMSKIGEQISKVNTIGGFSAADAEMGTACAECVLPTVNATPINMNPFRDMWTYVLIVDEASQFSSIGGTSRVMYSGFISNGEPVSTGIITTGINTGYHHNPHAAFTTTHVTRLNSVPSGFGDFRRGGGTTTNFTMYDNDFLPGDVIQNVSNGNNMCLLDPANLLKNRRTVGYDDNDQDMFYNNTVGEQYSVTPTPVNTSRESVQQTASDSTPTKHLRKIVSGLADTVRHMNSDYNVNNIGADPISTLASSMTSSNMYVKSNREINPGEVFFFQDLDVKYPNLTVHVVKQPANYQFNAMETGAPTAQNVAIAVITAAMPGVLTNRLCLSATMSYCSYMPGHNPMLPGLIEIHHMETFMPMDQITYANTVELIRDDIIRDIFSIVRAQFGEFRCDVTCSVAGDTVVNLQLMDFMDNINGMAVQSNHLGGINSCMVGSQDQCTDNAQQLMNLASVVRSNPVDSFNGFN